MTEFTFEPIFDSFWFALGTVIALTATIIATLPITPSRNQWWTLLALRSVAVLVLIIVVLRPSLTRRDRRPTPATVVVAVDRSESMTLQDGNRRRRWEVQKTVWEDLFRGVEALGDGLNLQVIAYAAKAVEQSPATTNLLDTLTPDGKATNVAVAIEEAIDLARGAPVAGVVLIGDGQQTTTVTAGRTQRGVASLNAIGVPLWTIPIGPDQGDAPESRDLAITGLADHFIFFAGNQTTVPFELSSRGFSGQTVSVSLTWSNPNGRPIETVSRSVTPTTDQAIPIALTLPSPPPGLYRLQAAVAVQAGELITTNNQQTAFVQVRDGGGRVLYLEGQARWERTFLSRTLREFPDLQVADVWIPANSIASWPARLETQIGEDRQDIYLIGDLDSDALGNPQMRRIADAVDAGAGLLMIGGLQNFAVGGYADSPLAKVIPVQLDGGLRRRPSRTQERPPAVSRDAGQISESVILRPARSHPITNLSTQNATNRDVWRALPAMPGATRFAGTKRIPGTQILLESERGDPMLVVGEYGRGRTAAVAFDATYRWAIAGNAPMHRRFWRQLVLWLLSREDIDDDKITLEMEKRRFTQTEKIPFKAQYQRNTAADQSTLRVELIDESGGLTDLTVTHDSFISAEAVKISGELNGLRPGIYRLRVHTENRKPKIDREIAFQVNPDSRELDQPAADPYYLRQLADATRTHGGRYFTPAEVDDLVKLLADRKAATETAVVRQSRLGDGPTSGWLIFLVFTAALGTEWAMRRRWNLP